MVFIGFMGNVEAKRLQVPLILAWAVSMHKEQGQTLQRVKVDLGKVVEKGQGGLILCSLIDKSDLRIASVCCHISGYHHGKPRNPEFRPNEVSLCGALAAWV